MDKLVLGRIGPIRHSELAFGDLTLFVGPQASGKSIALQWLKLALDRGQIQEELGRHGLDWNRDPHAFMDVFFGEGLRSLWRKDSTALWNNTDISPARLATRKGRDKAESLFFIPAQRVLALRDGWPRPFTDYSAGDPYVVRAFSERLRLIMEQEFSPDAPVFPKGNRLKADYRTLLIRSLFSGFSLFVDKERTQKRLVLGDDSGTRLPFMVWSAGQREFIPLLLGLYWLMPPAAVTQRNDIKWAVIEEPEMGLHPRAISAVLLLILELVCRGYKVCISTHSTQILELAWALDRVGRNRGGPDDVLDVLGAEPSQSLRRVAATCLKRTIRTYYFESGAEVRDISGLDPAASDSNEAGWGGLVDASARANEVVARVMASSR